MAGTDHRTLMNLIAPPDSRDHLAAILASDGDAVLTVIASVEGPSYRPVGAMMALLADNSRGAAACPQAVSKPMLRCTRDRL